MKICIFYTEGNLCGQIGLPWAMAVILGIYFSSKEIRLWCGVFDIEIWNILISEDLSPQFNRNCPVRQMWPTQTL